MELSSRSAPADPQQKHPHANHAERENEPPPNAYRLCTRMKPNDFRKKRGDKRSGLAFATYLIVTGHEVQKRTFAYCFRWITAGALGISNDSAGEESGIPAVCSNEKSLEGFV